MAVTKKMMFAREVKNLFGKVDEKYHSLYPDAGRVTDSVLFAFAWTELQKRPEYPGICWPDIARAVVVDSADVSAGASRYGSSLTLPVGLYPAIDFSALEVFRVACKADFVGIRRNCYLPFCVRLILKAFCLYCL